MASGSGRYQSKVFSFFSQQSLRWRDKAGQTLRQVQVAALWSLQILLYPVYTAFQTTRLVGRQIGRSVRQVIPQLQAAKTALTQSVSPSISVDTPLQHTLEILQPLLSSLSDLTLLDAAPSIPSPGNATIPAGSSAETALAQAAPLTMQALTIQGIASQLDTHDLVLVTTSNQVLEIFTPEQQAHLQRKIVWEVAEYWRQQRSQAMQIRGIRSTGTLLPPIGDRPKAWLPIRVFYRLMAWMQVSPVALATDLFQESQVYYLTAVDRGTIAALPSSDQMSATPALQSATPAWSSLDELFNDLLPVPQTDLSSDPQILSRLQASLVEIAQRSAQLASQLLQKSGIVLYAPSGTAPSQLESEAAFNPISQAALPQTATGFEQMRQKFFDRLNSHLQLPGQEPVSVQSSTNSLATCPPVWETFDPTQSRTLPPPTAANRQKKTQGRSSKPARISTSTAISPIEEYSACPIDPQAVATSIQPVSADSEASSLAAPTYIEAEVKLVQYVKHPLEQVLEWLDLGMLWLEKRLADLVRWLSDRMR